MDRSPPKLPNTSSRLIAMAVSLVGDARAVRAEMGCSQSDFDQYCAGQKEPAWPELDRLVQIIVREQGKLIAQNRDLIAQIRGKQSPKK